MKKRVDMLYCVILMGYLLGVRGSRIALWQDDDPEPIHVFPYCVSSLPQREQEQLTDGIHAENAVELVKLLEAYLP